MLAGEGDMTVNISFSGIQQADNRQGTHSTHTSKYRHKCTGFTMGISRGPLHWDNKNVVASEYKDHSSYRISTSFHDILPFEPRLHIYFCKYVAEWAVREVKCATCSLFQPFGQRICRRCFRCFLDEVWVKQKAGKYSSNMLSFLIQIFSFCFIFDCSCIAKGELHIKTTAPPCGILEHYTIASMKGKVAAVVYPSMP